MLQADIIDAAAEALLRADIWMRPQRRETLRADIWMRPREHIVLQADTKIRVQMHDMRGRTEGRPIWK